MKIKASGSLIRSLELSEEGRALSLRCPHFCRDRDNSASTQRRNHKGRQKPTAKYNKDFYSRQEVTCARKRKLPLQKPFKPDGVNRERRTGRENTRYFCRLAFPQGAVSSLGIHTFTHLWPPWGPQPKLGEFEVFT